MSDVRVGGAGRPVEPSRPGDSGAMEAVRPEAAEAAVVRGTAPVRRPLAPDTWAGYNLNYKHQGVLLSPAGEKALEKAKYHLHTGLTDARVSREDAEKLLAALEGLGGQDYSLVVRDLAHTFQDGRMMLQKAFDEVFLKEPALLDRFVDQAARKLGRGFDSGIPGNTGVVTDDMYRSYLTEYAAGEAVKKRAESERRGLTLADLKELPQFVASPYFVLGALTLPLAAGAKLKAGLEKALRLEP